MGELEAEIEATRGSSPWLLLSSEKYSEYEYKYCQENIAEYEYKFFVYVNDNIYRTNNKEHYSII